MKAILDPMKGKTISCNSVKSGLPTYNTTFYAYVDSSGNPYSRIVSNIYGDTGWIYGFSTYQYSGIINMTWNVGTWPSLTGNNYGPICTANWPMN